MYMSKPLAALFPLPFAFFYRNKWLVSLWQVHARVDTLAVGKLSLNLTCFNKENTSVFGNSLNLAVKNLLPITHSIPLSVDYLNTSTLAPRKDYETNRYAIYSVCATCGPILSWIHYHPTMIYYLTFSYIFICLILQIDVRSTAAS